MIPLDIPPPFDAAWFRFACGFIIGAVLGSFATMLAYRLPRHISIVTPRSHCPSCKALLGTRDLIPILSWIIGDGRCRHCQAKIGARYLWIELATSVGCGLASMVVGLDLALPFTYAGIVTVVVIACRLFKPPPT